MDSDPISEGTPFKRLKTSHNLSRRTYDSDDDSAEESFNDINETVPTQPLSQYQRPLPSQPQRKPLGIFSQTLHGLQNSTFETQPTQPLTNGHRSSPDVEVIASSPVKSSPLRQRPLSSSMAPPGTTFRRPMSIPSQVASASQVGGDRSTFSDPPVDLVEISDDEDILQSNKIAPTAFVKGGKKSGTTEARSSSFNFSQYAYNPRPADDLASAYGQGRRPKPQPAPSRARPVQVEMALDDISDHNERDKVERMKQVVPTKSISELLSALRQKKGHFDDAVSHIFAQEGDTIDLTSSDIESNVAKSAAIPRPKPQPLPAAKQDIRATKTIQEKYRSHLSPTKKALPSQISSVAFESSDTPPRRKGKLVQRKRIHTPDSDDDEGIQLPSDQSDSEAEPEPETSDSDDRLLDFLNTCSAFDLADLANTELATAELIISKRPFASFDAIREVSANQTTKAGKRARKAIGDKVLDVCTDMWEGYEAVDHLVDECKGLGQPIWDAMKKWGLNIDAVTKQGELEMTKFEDPQDSGIGTPSSVMSLDDDVVVGQKKRSAYLKQPAIMSHDLVMKDYQVFGLNWLNLLWSKRLSCILADDMGLGKTCQVISFLAHLKETRVSGTHLVVVPGSTLENWLREFNNFCPGLQVTPYYGSQKERAEARQDIVETHEDIDVIVTTYDVAANVEDNKFLRKSVRPCVVVYDEGHMLKNASSKRHKELMRIPATFRLLLTGTPLQNNLQELASLLGFILPALFEESRQSLNKIFGHKASTRDDSHAALLSAQRITRARSMIAPFILRRKKAQVLSELPAKHRRVQYCNMVASQQRLWTKLVSQARADREAAPVAGTARGRKAAGATASVHMSSLRFCALHPLLLRNLYTEDRLKKLQKILIEHPLSEYRGNRADLVWTYLNDQLKGGDYGLHKFCAEREDYIPVEFQLQKEEWMTMSGKMPVVKSLLESWISQGSRALIFSQFTTMLDILEAVLTTLNITFVRLDGSTRMQDRQERIDAFTADTSIKVFMLSTKAGGAGINLAAADKVIILEGGFNPQDEIQAENRAHRVGQTREVEVVRLVTRGTVEELILSLGESKLALDERVGAGIGSGGDTADQEGEASVEELFFKKLAEGGIQTPPVIAENELAEEDVAKHEPADEHSNIETLPDASDEHSEEDQDRPRRRLKRKRQTVTVDSSPPVESKTTKKTRAKPPAGGDIAAMFRKSMKGRGVDIGD